MSSPPEVLPDLRLALDQNFPLTAIAALTNVLPPYLHLSSLHQIDPRLSSLSDRSLILWLARAGWAGLITNNYRMLNIASEVAAIEATRSVLIAVKGLGDHPLRAAGAVLLDLPDIRRRIRPDRSNVFLLSYGPRKPERAWHHLDKIAGRQGISTSQLWESERPTPEELLAEPFE